mmetsp:Transcript_9211/g.10386  ORF Transcript_9211/g.10386 Transcript_9211/m.10386 type:complete len:118 (+) Transcript_9211:225-578(+)
MRYSAESKPQKYPTSKAEKSVFEQSSARPPTDNEKQKKTQGVTSQDDQPGKGILLLVDEDIIQHMEMELLEYLRRIDEHEKILVLIAPSQTVEKLSKFNQNDNKSKKIVVNHSVTYD